MMRINCDKWLLAVILLNFKCKKKTWFEFIDLRKIKETMHYKIKSILLVY